MSYIITCKVGHSRRPQMIFHRLLPLKFSQVLFLFFGVCISKIKKPNKKRETFHKHNNMSASPFSHIIPITVTSAARKENNKCNNTSNINMKKWHRGMYYNAEYVWPVNEHFLYCYYLLSNQIVGWGRKRRRKARSRLMCNSGKQMSMLWSVIGLWLLLYCSRLI